MTIDLTYPHQRALGDLLQAERDLRQKSDTAYRDLRQVLLEIAIRADGERFESLRRGDPSIPAVWEPNDWRKFFVEAPLSSSRGWGGVKQDVHAQRELMQQIEGLKASLKLSDEQLKVERSKPPIMVAPTSVSPTEAKLAENAQPILDLATLPVEATPPTRTLVEDVKRAMPSFPQTPPASFSKTLTGGGRIGGDLKRAYQRYWITLYLIGRWRIAASLEIEDILANAVGLSAGSGSLRRSIDDLKEFIISETIGIDNPHTALKLYRLSPEGERLYQALFGKRPFENEWSRLIRLHEGTRFPNHTLAVIEFAIHARKRGYVTQVFPEIKNSKVTSDVWISRSDETLHVEIEMDDEERTSKWCNQAALNNGKVALCAPTPTVRTSFVESCKTNQLHGLATDIETIVTIRFKDINEKTPLWLESW